MSHTRKRHRGEVFDFLLKKQFNAIASDKSYPANIAPLPKGKEPQVLRTVFVSDFDLDHTIEVLAFDLSKRNPANNRILSSDIYRSLVIGGLDWYDSIIAAGKPTPRIPIDHETRDAQKESLRRLNHAIKTT